MSVMSEWAYLRANDPEDEGLWPPRPGERDEFGELVEQLPETAELREWWPIDRKGGAT